MSAQEIPESMIHSQYMINLRKEITILQRKTRNKNWMKSSGLVFFNQKTSGECKALNSII